MFKTQINRLLMAVVLVNLCALIGCHRSYYRRQADAEALRLIREKSLDPRWSGATGTVDIDPQSRMFDPFSQDHPPIPPDDASSHQLMHCVDGKEGFPQWHANGDTNYVENPVWKSYLPMNEQGQVVLNLDRSFQLALINSPDYQQQREALYLSALEVSLQRFGFDSQLFVSNNTSLTAVPGATGATNSFGTTLQRLGTTGANFAVGLANTILFNFNSGGTQSASSLVDFSIAQPLLRGAGRDRIMESLTQAERDLLANIRQLERFRRGFYLDITVGRNPGINVNTNLLNLPGIAAAQAGGFLGLLDRQQRIRNQELNVRQLEAVLDQFREFFARERLDAVQLKRFENAFYSQQRNLLTAKTAYQDQLDRFKITLGLPPDLDVVIEDPFLDQFNLISDQVNEQLISIKDLRENTGAALNVLGDLFDDIGEPNFKWPENLAETVKELLPYIKGSEALLDQLVTLDRQQLEADFQKLDSSRPRRLAYLKKLKNAIESGQILSDIDIRLLEPESIPESADLRKLLENPETDDAEFITNEEGEKEIPARSIVKRAENLKQDFAETRKEIEGFGQREKEMTQDQTLEYIVQQFQEKIPGQLSELNTLVLELSLLQATARSNSIEINDVEIQAEQAIRIAKCFRRDWMNARAALVDSWRNIEFVADQLESQVDLVFEGDMGLVGNTPFKINYNTGSLRAGLRFDLPIVRLAERNRYRAALINYQQTRRRYYQFEDSIKQNIRQIVRNLDQNKVLFELDRRTVQIAIENIEVNRFELDRPVPPGASLRLGATTAQNLTDAIIGLNGNQNAFLSSWIQVEVLRRSLDYDMGTMQLNEMGEWVDPGEIGPSIGLRAAEIMGIDLAAECQFCENIGIPYSNIPSVDEDPAFDRTPMNADTPGNTPEQPPLEPLPEITPATPPPTEPEKPKPELNQPQTGMLRPQLRPQLSPQPSRLLSRQLSPQTGLSIKSGPQVPPLLFQPVKVRSAAKPKVAEDGSVKSSNDVSAIMKTNAASVDGSDPAATKFAALPDFPDQGIDSGPVNDLTMPHQTVAASVNWEEPVVDRETSGNLLSPLTITQAAAKPLSPLGAPVVEEPNSQASNQPAKNPTAEETKSADANSAFDWQSRPSSLGGILQRFQTQPSPKTSAETSKN